MLYYFFIEFCVVKILVMIWEYLILLEVFDKGVIDLSIGYFYLVSWVVLVKDEKDFDKFDMVFGYVFKGVEMFGVLFEIEEILDEWFKVMM